METDNYQILRNESIKEHTSLKIGGIVKCLIIPNNKKSLIQLIKKCIDRKQNYCIIGKGSNLLINDTYHDKYFIKNTRALNNIYRKGTDVYAESSISLKKLATFCLKNNLNCLDFLYCIPGTLGGAIYMNAGRGEIHNTSISKYIKEVEVFDGTRTFCLKNEECMFSHRTSIFQRKKYLILSCILRLPKQDIQDGLNKIRERIKFVQKTQDLEFPSAGTVFKNNFSLMKQLKGYQIGGAKFSEKNPSFIINVDNASFDDVNGLIEYAKEYYRLRKFSILKTELCIIS